MTATTFSEQDGSVSQSVLELLANPRSYPESTRNVERIDTHISWVFLTDRYAYKLKKPVKFEFLDFSTPQKRQYACEQEVHLNRRLAPDVYLGVVPITRNQRKQLQMFGAGQPVDWLVKMRRLPAPRALDQLISADCVSEADVKELAKYLSSFYEQLPPLNIEAEQYRRRIERHMLANRDALADSGFGDSRLKRIHAAQMRTLQLAPELLDCRVCDGRIVDGHGDLRPDHIYFHPHPIIIDCLEFSSELRQLDVADELAFLAVECEYLDAGWISDRILAKYRDTTGDQIPSILLDTYKTYRACVRAKVLSLRARQLEPVERENQMKRAERYLQLADQRAGSLGPPLLLAVYGLSGAGKTTLAEGLAKRLQIDWLGTDAVRRGLFGSTKEATTYNSGHYRFPQRLRVYEEMFRQAEALLRQGCSVILDGTFPTEALRRQIDEVASRHAALPLLLHCQCNPQVARERIVARSHDGHSMSDATTEIYQQQRSAHEPDPSDLPICRVNTDAEIGDAIQTVFEKLRSLVVS